MFDVKSSIAGFNDQLAKHDNPIVTLALSDSVSDRAFTYEDASLAHALINLPDEGRLPLAYVSGRLRGADLALALFCPLIAVNRGAELMTGFHQPASAAAYVAAARRLGPVVCERLLFGSEPCTAEDAGAAHLAEVVTSMADAVAFGESRVATIISVARANLVTWPMPLAKLRVLVDAP